MKRLAMLALLGLLLTAGVVWSAEQGKSSDNPAPQTTGTSPKDTDKPKDSDKPKDQDKGGKPTPGEQQGDTSSTSKGTLSPDLNKVGNVLIVFLVLSVVFEVALTPLFNWMLFLERWDGKGKKTPIIIGLGFLLFWGYDLDIVRDLLVALGRPDGPPRFGGQVLSALLMAGGSSGVLEMFRKFGIREPAGERKKRVSEIQTAYEKRQREKEEAGKQTS